MSGVVNAADILGGTITGFEEKKVPGWYNPGESDDDVQRDVHFYTITTEKGRADVILHVDHNGYYGGELAGPEVVGTMPSTALIPED